MSIYFYKDQFSTIIIHTYKRYCYSYEKIYTFISIWKGYVFTLNIISFHVEKHAFSARKAYLSKLIRQTIDNK